jgi:tripartite-type tricarboxylate transporter receptor subunit TctC
MQKHLQKAFTLLTVTLVVTGACLGHATPVSAQAYPAKPVRFIVPFAPGGGTDIIGRSLAQPLSEALGQPVLIDNRAGAGGAIGAEAVARSAPDGYTLLMGTPGSLTINPNLMAKVTYSLNDFAPITLATISPFVIVVHPATPAGSIRELVALAKAKPNALNYGSSGNGSVSHLAGEQFKSLAGVQITHIPYKSGGQSITDLIAGQVQINFENLPVTLPHVRSGKLRLLAVGTTRRSAQVPETPTVAETLPGYEASTSSGVLSVARTPAEIINRLNRDLVRIIQGPSFRDKFRADGWEAVGSTPEQYAAHLREESARIAATAKAAGITLD